MGSSSDENILLKKDLVLTRSKLALALSELGEVKMKLTDAETCSDYKPIIDELKGDLERAQTRNDYLKARLKAREDIKEDEKRFLDSKLFSIVLENKNNEIVNLKTFLGQKDAEISNLKLQLLKAKGDAIANGLWVSSSLQAFGKPLPKNSLRKVLPTLEKGKVS